MKFIKVLRTNGYETYVNVDHIIRIKAQTSNCTLVMSNAEELYLQISAEEVLNLIKEA